MCSITHYSKCIHYFLTTLDLTWLDWKKHIHIYHHIYIHHKHLLLSSAPEVKTRCWWDCHSSKFCLGSNHAARSLKACNFYLIHSGLKGETPEKKCLQQSVNGFFHQNIYWFWKALTPNLWVGSFWVNPTKWGKKLLKIEIWGGIKSKKIFFDPTIIFFLKNRCIWTTLWPQKRLY